eukprot:TRINITY_DN38259_c0_g1_i1.p1 TRINITY_DN38259_c0_g1~~TRINITY_DN38259_c0_g1_i1.p1  ORF type:complete len:220 (+),score=30.92 TRINITY_DN38259_c0_g1_i1:60-662(+)
MSVASQCDENENESFGAEYQEIEVPSASAPILPSSQEDEAWMGAISVRCGGTKICRGLLRGYAIYDFEVLVNGNVHMVTLRYGTARKLEENMPRELRKNTPFPPPKHFTFFTRQKGAVYRRQVGLANWLQRLLRPRTIVGPHGPCDAGHSLLHPSVSNILKPSPSLTSDLELASAARQEHFSQITNTFEYCSQILAKYNN